MAISRAAFLERTLIACEHAVAACPRYAVQDVPDAYALLVHPNSSFDGHLRSGEVTFPDDSLPEGARVGPLSPEDFVTRFWREGCVPEWIDVRAWEVTAAATLLEVQVCGRFTDRLELLYHQERGIPPFHPLGPALPPAYEVDAPAIQRFDINWHLASRRRGPAGRR